jgi:hypothetical protein
VFCFGNLLAGPVIEFRDYQMWVRHEGPWAPSARQVPWTGDFKAVGRDDISLVMVVTAMSGTLHGRVRTQAPCTDESRLLPAADKTQSVAVQQHMWLRMWVRHEGPWEPSARKVPWTGDFKAVSAAIQTYRRYAIGCGGLTAWQLQQARCPGQATSRR